VRKLHQRDWAAAKRKKVSKSRNHRCSSASPPILRSVALLNRDMMIKPILGFAEITRPQLAHSRSRWLQRADLICYVREWFKIEAKGFSCGAIRINLDPQSGTES